METATKKAMMPKPIEVRLTLELYRPGGNCPISRLTVRATTAAQALIKLQKILAIEIDPAKVVTRKKK